MQKSYMLFDMDGNQICQQLVIEVGNTFKRILKEAKKVRDDHIDDMSILQVIWIVLDSHPELRQEGLAYEVLQWYMGRMEAWFAVDADLISLKTWDQAITNKEDLGGGLEHQSLRIRGGIWLIVVGIIRNKTSFGEIMQNIRTAVGMFSLGVKLKMIISQNMKYMKATYVRISNNHVILSCTFFLQLVDMSVHLLAILDGIYQIIPFQDLHQMLALFTVHPYPILAALEIT
ncbi:hypothetical protein K2173_003755 [Erythroxylum novogranatense]|uniref:Uncharacterized protein n=1 Tax=Erythroxylum novogranatense TaxID=1862640 RepID=A0AAV8SIS6_9ROSI|nr:hypothetical protein K2173_003755 [Erythroxylum novogranatense]